MIAIPLAVAVMTALVLAGMTTGARRPLVARSAQQSKAQDRDRNEHRPPRPFGPRRRRSRVEPSAVAAWCDDLARCLRHGSTLRAAIATIVPVDESVERRSAALRHRIERGHGVGDASDGWSSDLEGDTTPGVDALETLAVVLSATATVGGNAAEPIDRFASAMRQRQSEDLERIANAAQARLSAWVLTIIPLALLALLFVIDGDVRSAVMSPTGATAVGIGLALNALGGWWMRRIAAPPAERRGRRR